MRGASERPQKKRRAMTTQEHETDAMLDPKHDDIELVEALGVLVESEGRIRDRRQRIEHELKRRMEESGAREIYHPTWTCKLIIPSPDYDIGKLQGKLGEIIPPEVWDKGFTKPHDKTVHVEAAFDMRVVKGWATAYGDAVREIVETAMLPKPARLQIKRREG